MQLRHGDGEIRHLELIDRQPLQVFSMLYNKYNTYLEITWLKLIERILHLKLDIVGQVLKRKLDYNRRLIITSPIY